MDLRKVSDHDKLRLCQKYTILWAVHTLDTYRGFVFLPFLWFVNIVWFLKYAFFVERYEEQKKIRLYIIGSFVGFLVWFIALTAWVVIYQEKRASWGATGDQISFLIPLGKP